MKIANKKAPRKGRIWRLIRNLILIFFLGSVSWVLIAGFVPVWVTPLMLIRTVEAVVDGETPRNSKKWVP
ncbi:MAG: monofunctional biosynthetic peptidoglycan transglycosylase, partial [Paludibacter sp.]|nr:monofunctional biosynthetic peptidoglycan transglycosylase [Paludibacter sp.]